MLAPDQSPFPDNPACKLCITKPCRQLFTGRVYPGKMIFVHHGEFLSWPCHQPNFGAATEENAEEAALTDDIEVTTGNVEISNPRWEPLEEAEANGDPQVPMMGDKVRLLADVKNYPSGAPVSFDIYDVTDSTPLRITTVKGSNDNGKAAVEWTVEDPQKRGKDLKLQFEAGAKSKYTQKADLPWNDKIRCDFVEMPDILFHHNSAVPCLDSGESLLGALVAAFTFFKDNPDKVVVLFGHTDTSGEPDYNYDLSEWRSEAIKALLDNKDDAWVAAVEKASEVEDYQQILKVLTDLYGWNCDPGMVDNISGEKTRAAVRAFQEQYEKGFKETCTPDGVVGKQTWKAIFKVIRSLVEAAASEAIEGALPSFSYGNGGSGIYPCGEAFPVEEKDRDGLKSATNRRVEIVFFDKGKEPALKPPAKKKPEKKDAPVYDDKKTDKKPIPPKQPKSDGAGKKKPPPANGALKSFSMWCSHSNKHKAFNGGVLEVVPPAGTGDKVSLLAECDGDGKTIKWATDGWTKDKFSGKEGTTRVNSFKTPMEDLLPVNGVWAGRLKPHIVDVSASEGGNQLSAKIYAYPSNALEFSVDFSKNWTKIRAIEKRVSDVLKKIIGKNIEFEFLQGSIAAGGGFEEDKDTPEVFFAFFISGKIDPIVAAKFTIPIPLTGFYSFIPSNLRDYVGNIEGFVKFTGSVGASVNIKRSSREKASVEGGAKEPSAPNSD